MHHLHEFDAGENPARIVKGFESEHQLQTRFDASMILVDYVVQVLTAADPNWVLPTGIEFIAHPHPAQRRMVASKPSIVMVRGSPCRFSALRKNALAAATSRVRVR